MEVVNESNNFSVDVGGALVKVNVNPSMFALDVVYSAAYVFLDKNYVFLDGDRDKNILVHLKPKETCNDEGALRALAGEFSNMLVNYSVYKTQVERNSKLREAIMQRVVLTNSQISEPVLVDGDVELSEGVNEASPDGIDDFDDEDWLEDPEGIAVPWEEKYGDKSEEVNSPDASGSDADGSLEVAEQKNESEQFDSGRTE